MKTRKILTIMVVALGLILHRAGVSEATPMGTAFTYQGHLYDANYVADGLYDFQFKLYDADSDGNQVGGDVNKPDEDVINGYFAVELDFGSDVFDGNGIWLEIGVRPGDQNDPCEYTVLTPRLEITPLPYALQTRGIFVDDAGNVGIGTTSPEGLLHVGEGSFVVTRGLDNSVGISDQNARERSPEAKLEITTGIGKDFLMVSSTPDADGDMFIVKNDGKVGIGTASPGAKLEVNGDVKITDGTQGAGKVLTSDDNGLASWQVLSGDSDWAVSGNNMYSIPSGNVGIGTTGPGDKLDVDGHINSSESYKLDGETILSNTGTDNIFVGEDAGVSNTTGHRNSAVGYQALYSNTEGNYNSAVGYRALYDNTTGSFNTAMGLWALWSNNTGSYNTAMGSYALQENTTGNSNSAIGHSALSSNTEGSSNSAVGYQALNSNTTGNYNSAMGLRALYSNTEGTGNSAMGYYALQDNTTGGYNSAMGYRALMENSSGLYNVAMGSGALVSNTTGSHNSAVGLSALYFNTTGNENVALGSLANYYNQEGSRNTIIGYYAGRGTLAHNKSGNVFLGYMAGYNETGSNKLYIENSDSNSPLIYGEFNNDIVAINGSLGIGTKSPSEALDVKGTAKADLFVGDGSGLTNVPGTPDSDWIISDGNMYSAASGNVGIGTTSPGDKLDVYGPINSRSSYKIDGITVLSNDVDNNIFVGWWAGENNEHDYGKNNSAVGNNALKYNEYGSNNSAMGYYALMNNIGGNYNSAMGDYALLFNTYGHGNTAIGSSALLHNTTGWYNTALGCYAGYNNSTGSGNVFIGYGAGCNETDSNTLYIENSDSNSPLIYGEFDNDIVAINGSLGIGTTNPTGILDVNGHINSSESYKIDGETVLSNTGRDNIFVGEGVGSSITTGYRNSAMGYHALRNNTDGTGNSAIGYYALRYNTTGGHNIAIGYSALQYNTTGYYNTAIGNSALYSNTTGQFNSALGLEALRANTTGNQNTAMGSSALQNNTGSYNTAVGYQAGMGNFTGSGNVFIGNRAGYSATGNNTLYIDNNDVSIPLIFGNFALDIVAIGGGLGVSRAPLTNRLEVEGNASKTTAGDWLANSDARIKTDIQTVTGALDTLDKVRLVSFKYTDDYRNEHSSVEDRRYLNVIAQEFRQVFPDYVRTSGEQLPNGDEILQVDAYPLTVYSAAAVQELHNIVKAKDSEIAQLKERVSKMETLLAKLTEKREGGQR